MRSQNIRISALYVTLSALAFACMGAAVKEVSQVASNEMIVFVRNLLGMLVLVPWIASNGLSILKTQILPLHLLRGLAGLGAMYCFFYALAHMDLARAVLLNFSAPLFMPFIALLWLKESFSRKLLIAIAIGFVGISLVLKPDSDIDRNLAMIGIGAGLFAALAMVTIRRLTASEPPARIVFYFALTGTTVSVIPMLLNWTTPDQHTLVLLLTVGIFASLGQILLTRGYSLAPAATAAPFTYMTVIFAAIFGWIVWDESVDLLTLIGGSLVCLAGILAIRYGGTKTPAEATEN